MMCRTYGILCPVIDPVHHLMRARHPCLAIFHEPMPIQLYLEMPGLLNLNHLQDLPKFLVRIPVHKRLLYWFIYTSFADHRRKYWMATAASLPLQDLTTMSGLNARYTNRCLLPLWHMTNRITIRTRS